MIVDRSSAELDGYFNQVYSDLGRPSIPPEPLLPEIPGIGRATALISVDRSEAMTPMRRYRNPIGAFTRRHRRMLRG